MWVCLIHMQPITRETIVDRRQQTVRWSAILAGTAFAVGMWGVIQVLGIGVGLTALDPDHASSVGPAAYGTGILTVIAPLFAMFAGGYLAAKLANTYDRRVAAAHAAVVWGLTAAAGLIFTLWMASQAALGAAKAVDKMDRQPDVQVGVVNDAQNEARDALVPINNRLRLADKPQISADQLVAAVRGATDDGVVDRDDLEKGLAKESALSKDEAAGVVTELGPRVNAIAQHANRSTPQEHDAMDAAETAGKALLALGVAILLGFVTALGGAMLAMRRFGKDDDHRGNRVIRDMRDTEMPVHTTAQYPTTTPTTSGV